MDSIGDDFNLQTVKQVTAFNQPQYAPSPFLVMVDMAE